MKTLDELQVSRVGEEIHVVAKVRSFLRNSSKLPGRHSHTIRLLSVRRHSAALPFHPTIGSGTVPERVLTGEWVAYG
jgi:hypothetical protein